MLFLKLPQFTTTFVPVHNLQNREYILSTETALRSLSGEITGTSPGHFSWCWVMKSVSIQ